MAIPFTVRLTDKPHLIGKGELCRISKAVFTDWKCKRCIFYCFLGAKNFFHKFLFSYRQRHIPPVLSHSRSTSSTQLFIPIKTVFLSVNIFPLPFLTFRPSLNPEGEAVRHRSDLLTRFFRVFRRFSRCLALSAANWEQLPHILETAAGGNQMPFLNMATHSWKKPGSSPGTRLQKPE